LGGNAGDATGNSTSVGGNITIDAGQGNTGVNGAILIGNSNASAVTVGNSSTNSSLTLITGSSNLTLNSSQFVVIGTTGAVGIGTTSPSALLHVGSTSASGIVMELQNSSGACTFTPGTSSMTSTCSSDVRLKTDIHDTDDALPWLVDMRVRDFTVKATGESSTGVIAQEMLINHPEMVHANAEGFYGVDVPNPWKMIKALQELKNMNEALKAANDDEAAEIKELRERIEALEAARR
jgi:Chaperone of endosialidase